MTKKETHRPQVKNKIECGVKIRSMIEAHDGKLNFYSQLGKGSTFYFTLPI